ncbi:MAG: tetratricopeptide repeat protein [Bacteroidales bacterium]|nr:tetratricopeptide repeat protein [Bacteroidales bacterium]
MDISYELINLLTKNKQTQTDSYKTLISRLRNNEYSRDEIRFLAECVHEKTDKIEIANCQSLLYEIEDYYKDKIWGQLKPGFASSYQENKARLMYLTSKAYGQLNLSFNSVPTQQTFFLTRAAQILNSPWGSIFLVGRDMKTADFEYALNNNKIILVHGQRGSGKTTFVHKAIGSRLHMYSHIAYVTVKDNNLIEASMRAFHDYSMANQGKGLRYYMNESDTDLADGYDDFFYTLKNFPASNPIYIIDNANNREYIQSFIDYWLIRHKIPWTLVITSVCKNINGCEHIELPQLEDEDCIKIFERHSGDKPFDKEALKKHLKGKGNNPLYCECLGKQYGCYDSLDLDDLCQKIPLENRPANINPSVIKEKVGQDITTANYIEMLFNNTIKLLSNDERKILEYFVLLPSEYYATSFLIEIFALKQDDTYLFRRLCDKGWIIDNTEGGTEEYKFHEITKLGTHNLLSPSPESVKVFINTISNIITYTKQGHLKKAFADMVAFIPLTRSIISYFFHNLPEVMISDPTFSSQIREMVYNRNNISDIKVNDDVCLISFLEASSILLSDSGEKDFALKVGYEGLNMYLRLHTSNTPDVIDLLLTMAKLTSQNGNASLSMDLRILSDEVFLSLNNPPDYLRYKIKRDLALSYRVHKLFDLSIKLLEDCVNFYKTSADYSIELALTYDNLGFSASIKSNEIEKTDPEEFVRLNEKSIEFRIQALELHKNTLGPDHTKTAVTHNNLGVIYSKLNKFENSLKHYTICYNIRDKKLPEIHTARALILNNIASLKLKIFMNDKEMNNDEKYTILLEALEKAVKAKDMRLAIYKTDSSPFLGSSMHTVAEILYHLFKYRKTKEDLDSAYVHVQKALISKNSMNPKNELAIEKSEKLKLDIENELKNLQSENH